MHFAWHDFSSKIPPHNHSHDLKSRDIRQVNMLAVIRLAYIMVFVVSSGK